MIAVDTNILLHAHRAELDHHDDALRALRRLAEGTAPWGLPAFVIGEFVRMATHPRIFQPPSSLEHAFRSLDALMASPSCKLLLPGAPFAALLARLCRDHDLRGNRVFDAQIAAVCLEHGVTELLTFDRDFDRIRELRAITP